MKTFIVAFADAPLAKATEGGTIQIQAPTIIEAIIKGIRYMKTSPFKFFLWADEKGGAS